MVLELQLNTIKIPGVSQHWQSVTVTVAGPDGGDSPGPGTASDHHKSCLQQKIGSVFTVTPSPCPPHGSVRLFIK